MLIKATETTQKAERVVARQQREEELARKAQRHKEEMARREVEKAQRAAERAALAALPRAPRPPREPRPPRPKAPKPPRPPKPLKEKKIKLRLCKLILPDSSSFDLKRSYAGMERRPGKKRKVAEAADAAVDVAAQAVAATAPPRVEVSASAEDAGASASPAEAEGDGAAAAPAEAEGAGPAEDAQPSVESQLERAALVAELTEAVGGPVDVVPPTDDPMAEDVGSQPISAPEAGAADDVTTDTAPLVAQDRANAASEGVGEQESAAPEAGAANIATNETAPVVAQARDDAVAEGVDDQATSAPEARAAADKTAEADPTVAQARDDTAVTPVAVTAASVTPTGETSVIEPATGAVATLDEATENDLVAQKDDTAVVELATKEDAALNEATGTPVPVDEVLDDTAPFNPASQLDAVTEAMNADVDDDSDGDSDNPDVDADLDDNGEPDETMDVDEPLADRSDEEDEEIEVGYDDEEAALNEPDAGYDVAYDGEEDEEADEEEADEVLDVDAYDDYPEVTFVADSDEDEDDDHYDGAEFTYAAESDEERAINEPLPKKRRRPRKKPRPPPAVPRRVFYGTAPTHSRPRPAKRRRIQRVYVEIVTRNPYCFPSRNTSEVEDELELEWSDNDAPRPVMITHKPPPGSAWATATRVISLARKEGYSSGYIVVEKQTVPDLTPLVVGKLHPPLNFIPLPPTPPPPRLATPAPAPSGSDFGGGEMWEPLGGADIEGVALLQDVGMSPLRSATRPGPSSPLLPVRAPRASSPLLPARSAYVTPSRPAATPAPPLPSVLTLRSLLTTPVSATSTPANAAPVPRPTPTPTQQSDALDTEFASEAANIQNSYDSELDAENARFAALLEAERQRHAQAVAALASRYKGQVERLNHEVVRTANEIDVRGSAEASVEAGPSAPTQTDAAPGA
ncbi:hypothetical protein Q8F55_009096 [Vanrija albida]|uniref:Uncharacterized protein n=1 Tax=Vanrija albida TaxID=181172 RepID=A0ABR3PSN3_9TREE